MEALQQLLNTEAQDTFHEAWSTFFLNPVLVRQLEGIIDKDSAVELIKAGGSWSGSGWNTGRASKHLFDLVGVPLVSSNFLEYRNAFLYSLAVVWSVDVPQMELSDRAAQAAFAIAQCIQSPPAGVASRPFGSEVPQDVEATPQDGEVCMEWDEPSLPLPQELLVLWQGVQAGQRKLNLAQVLEQVPRFAELPHKPAENNFRSQGKTALDRQLRTYQQTLLHLLRLWGTCYLSEDDQEASQRFRMAWQLTCELYYRLHNDRKEASIPGSTSSSSTQLFGKDDVAQVTLVNKVNAAGKGGWRPGYGKGRFRGFGRCAIHIQKVLSSANTQSFRFNFRGKGNQGRGNFKGGNAFSQGGFKGSGGKGVPEFKAMAATDSHLTSQVEREDDMVGQGGPITSATTAARRSLSRLDSTRFRCGSLPQKCSRSAGCPDPHAGIRRNWSSPPGIRVRSPQQISHPLVPHKETRCGGG